MNEQQRNEFLSGLNEDFARLRLDAEAWSDEREERAAWDATLADGLEDEEP